MGFSRTRCCPSHSTTSSPRWTHESSGGAMTSMRMEPAGTSLAERGDDVLRATLAGELTEARERTLCLLTPLSDDDLRRQHDPLMSPPLWDLGHIAAFEELWLTRNLSGQIEFG